MSCRDWYRVYRQETLPWPAAMRVSHLDATKRKDPYSAMARAIRSLRIKHRRDAGQQERILQ